MNTTKYEQEILSDFPVLQRKLRAFCEDYSLQEKPALVWQCAPSAGREVEVDSVAVWQSLSDGVSGADESEGWWYGFHSGRRPVPVFDGLAACSASDDQGWTTEVHSDGHILGGLWSFPNVPQRDGSTNLCISDFHSGAFSDFAALATAINGAGQIEYPCLLTCTMLNARQLRYQAKRGTTHYAPLRRASLQWRVRAAESAEQVSSVMSIMAKELFHAFGQPR